MNNLFKSLVVFVFTTNIMGMHAHGGGHMKGNSADWEIETYTRGRKTCEITSFRGVLPTSTDQ